VNRHHIYDGLIVEDEAVIADLLTDLGVTAVA